MKPAPWKRIVISLSLWPSIALAQPTYKDVAPIFIRRCGDCHHQGKIFPSLTNYGSISLYKGIIASNLQSGKMPPWPADTTYMRFSHEHIITQGEKARILNWLAAGGPAGDTSLAPPPPHYPAYQLSGTPDLVLNTPEYVSNASYTDRNVCFSLPTGLTQDRVLRAYELVPANPNLAHHMLLAIDSSGTSATDLSGSCSVTSLGSVMGGWAPGTAPVVFPSQAPARLGIRIKQGSDMVLQVHYPAGTDGLSDSIQLRLYFYPLNTPAIRPINVFAIKSSSFTIPVDTALVITAMYPWVGTLPEDLSVFSIFPHSHKICTGIKDFASIGTTTIPLCRIPNWNFEWQGSYVFRRLAKVPAGSRFYGQHLYDNTSANPNHSLLPVSQGPGSEDEMLIDMLLCAKYVPGDENLNIDSLIRSDSLLLPLGLETPVPGAVTSFAYPNPFRERVTIICELPSEGGLSLAVYDIMGRRVREVFSGQELQGIHTYNWDGRTDSGGAASPGLYFYKLRFGATVHCGKMLLSPTD